MPRAPICGVMLRSGKWRMKQEKRYGRFSTRLDEVLIVNEFPAPPLPSWVFE